MYCDHTEVHDTDLISTYTPADDLLVAVHSDTPVLPAVHCPARCNAGHSHASASCRCQWLPSQAGGWVRGWQVVPKIVNTPSGPWGSPRARKQKTAVLFPTSHRSMSLMLRIKRRRVNVWERERRITHGHVTVRPAHHVSLVLRLHIGRHL